MNRLLQLQQRETISFPPLDNLYNIFIIEFVVFAYSLWVVLD